MFTKKVGFPKIAIYKLCLTLVTVIRKLLVSLNNNLLCKVTSSCILHLFKTKYWMQDPGQWMRSRQLPIFYAILYCVCVKHQKMDEIWADRWDLGLQMRFRLVAQISSVGLKFIHWSRLCFYRNGKKCICRYKMGFSENTERHFWTFSQTHSKTKHKHKKHIKQTQQSNVLETILW